MSPVGSLEAVDFRRGPIGLVAVKAFGDLVIAVNCCQTAPTEVRARLRIILGEHLVPLFDALDSDLPISLVRHGENSLPSLFTVKKDGVLKAYQSALSLKRAFIAANLPGEMTLLFDRLGARERYVTRGWPREVIPSVGNIYLSYDQSFGSEILAMPGRGDTPGAAGPLRIFPGSRVPAKNMSYDLIKAIIDTSAGRGVPTELILLDGERPDLEASDLPFTLLPRDFGATIRAVRGAGKVVSADSMPAHIAEYVGRPVFVFSPVDNRYWLPRSAFLGHWSALFNEGCASARFGGFLDLFSAALAA